MGLRFGLFIGGWVFNGVMGLGMGGMKTWVLKTSWVGYGVWVLVG